MRALVGSDTLSPGDTLGITIFENVKDDPLLGNTGQRVSALTEVQVDGQGNIFIPYAGSIKAAGQTPDGLRQAITRKLDAQTPDPQVLVARLAGDGSSVTISGAVAALWHLPDRASDPHPGLDAGQGGRRVHRAGRGHRARHPRRGRPARSG